MNRTQSIIITVGTVFLGLLLLFPPWQQAGLREVDYRHNLGHGFILHPPKPVAIDCYFVGCLTAPPSYFHVLLHSRLFIGQCGTVLGIGLAAVWLFRRRRDSTHATLQSPKTRLISSMLIALAVPPSGDFPLASMLLDIPKLVVDGGEKWQVPVVAFPVLFIFCAGIIYVLLTLAFWLSTGWLARAPADPLHR